MNQLLNVYLLLINAKLTDLKENIAEITIKSFI